MFEGHQFTYVVNHNILCFFHSMKTSQVSSYFILLFTQPFYCFKVAKKQGEKGKEMITE